MRVGKANSSPLILAKTISPIRGKINSPIRGKKTTSIQETSSELIRENMTIPVSDEELGLLNKIVMPNTFDRFTDFDGSFQSSIIFYQNFDTLDQVLFLSNQTLPPDLLRRVSQNLPFSTPLEKLSHQQLVDILFARILYTFQSL